MGHELRIICPFCNTILMERVVASMAQGKRMKDQVLEKHLKNCKEVDLPQ